MACSSSINSCIIAVVTFSLSWNLLLKLEEGPAEVTAPDVDTLIAFFPLSGGLTPFPFPLHFLPCPTGAVFRTSGPASTLLLVTTTGCYNVT